MIQVLASVAACILIVMSVYLAFLKFADMASDMILTPVFDHKDSGMKWWPSITCMGLAMGIIYAVISEVV